jgi:hypothetical protein
VCVFNESEESIQYSCSSALAFFMERDIELLVNLTMHSPASCEEAYRKANHDINEAASLLLSAAINEVEIITRTDSNSNVIYLDESDDSSSESVAITIFDEAYILIIPHLRLGDLYRQVIVPKGINLTEILRCQQSLSIPEGVTLCEITSSSRHDLEDFISHITSILEKYKMSVLLTANDITNPDKRILFKNQINDYLYDVIGVGKRAIHRAFHERVIPQSAQITLYL